MFNNYIIILHLWCIVMILMTQARKKFNVYNNFIQKILPLFKCIFSSQRIMAGLPIRVFQE